MALVFPDQPRNRRILPSRAQTDYLLILFNDCGFTINSRNAWLTAKFHRLIGHLDDLSIGEASQVISELKVIRENQK